MVVVAELRAARVTGRALLDELAIRDPRGLDDEAGVLEGRPAGRRRFGPGHVARAGTMAGLAAHVDLGPRRRVGVRLRVEALDQVRGVALRAHAVPVLPVARPVEPVGTRDPLARVEEEPSLPGHVPRQGEGLHAPAWKADEVLLERIPAEGVGHREDRGLPVGPVGLDEELRPVAKEAGLHPVALENDAGEIAPHRRSARLGHGAVVVRSRPRLRLPLVAARARRPPHEVRRDSRPGRGRREAIRGEGRAQWTRPRGWPRPAPPCATERGCRSSSQSQGCRTRAHDTLSGVPRAPRPSMAGARALSTWTRRSPPPSHRVCSYRRSSSCPCCSGC